MNKKEVNKDEVNKKFDCLIDCWLINDDKTLNNKEKIIKIKNKLKEVKIMDKKLFKKTFPFVCSECDEFAYLNNEYCETCGSYHTVRKTEKEDYKEHFKK